MTGPGTVASAGVDIEPLGRALGQRMRVVVTVVDLLVRAGDDQ